LNGKNSHTQSTEHAQIYWQAFTLRDHHWANRKMNDSLATIKFLADNKARGIICDAIGHNFHIKIVQVEQLLRSSGGKFEEFVSRI
jgi:hypothetical protein